MVLRLFPLLVITFVDSLSLGISVALLPSYIVSLHASDVIVGLVFSTVAFGQLVTGPAWMYASGRFGRKRVVVFGQLGAVASWLILAFSTTIGGVFVARAIEGLSGGNWSMTMAYITDLVEPRDYPNAFAYANATSSAAIIVGPLFGGLLEARAGFDAGFLIAAGLQALALAVALVFLQVPRGATTLAAPATLGETLATLRHPAVRPLLLQQATATLAINGWFAIATLSITILLGVGAGRASETFAMFGIWTFVMEVFVVGRLINRFGARVSSNLSLASLTASFLLFAFTHDYATLVGVFVLFSFGFAVHEATMPAMLSARVTAGQRGMVLEASQTVENVTKVVVPPISTGVLGIFGPGVATGLSAVLSAGALGMGLALAGKEPRDVRSSPR